MAVQPNIQQLSERGDFALLTPGQDVIRVGGRPYLFNGVSNDLVSLKRSPDGLWEIEELRFRLEDATFANGGLQVPIEKRTVESYVGGGIKQTEMEPTEVQRSADGFYRRREGLIKVGLLS